MSSLCSEPLADAWLKEGYCADELQVNVASARSIVSIGTTESLVVDRGTSPTSVVRLHDSSGSGNIADTLSTLVTESGLTHGLTIHGGYLYASSATTVFRWPYQPGDTSVGPRETVITGMNADGNGGAPLGHRTRTLILDSTGRLYVAIGSNDNVDLDSFRSRIRRFDLSSQEQFPIDFVTGEVFADGLRNEVGLAFDKHGILWGVENGADGLKRADLGGDIHNDNPAEELNRFPEKNVGKHWGYPFCWSEFELDAGLGRNTRWAWPSFMGDTIMNAGYTDEYCRTETLPSELSMQAHSAPLGIVFYNYTSTVPSGCSGAFPADMDGYAFIAFHGSWNRDIPTGYKVVYVPMNSDGRIPEGEEARDLLRHDGFDAKWDDGFRPVDVDFDDCGRLLVTSDGSGGRGAKVVRIAYENPTPTPAPAPTSGTIGGGPATPPTPGNLGGIAAGRAEPTPAPTSGTLAEVPQHPLRQATLVVLLLGEPSLLQAPPFPQSVLSVSFRSSS